LNNIRFRDIFTSNRLKPFYSRFELKTNKRAVIPNIQKTNIDLWEDDVRDENNENENDDNDEEEEKNREKQLTIPKNQ
jgi:hypothetical protein